jgi:hypothetical protein
VLGLMNSCAAISWLVAPSAARREICASWGGQVVARLDGAFAGVLAGRVEPAAQLPQRLALAAPVVQHLCRPRGNHAATTIPAHGPVDDYEVSGGGLRVA